MSRVNPSMDLAAIVRVLERCPGLHGVPRPLLVHLAGFLVHEQLQPQQIVPSPAAGSQDVLRVVMRGAVVQTHRTRLSEETSVITAPALIGLDSVRAWQAAQRGRLAAAHRADALPHFDWQAVDITDVLTLPLVDYDRAFGGGDATCDALLDRLLGAGWVQERADELLASMRTVPAFANMPSAVLMELARSGTPQFFAAGDGSAPAPTSPPSAGAGAAAAPPPTPSPSAAAQPAVDAEAALGSPPLAGLMLPVDAESFCVLVAGDIELLSIYETEPNGQPKVYARLSGVGTWGFTELVNGDTPPLFRSNRGAVLVSVPFSVLVDLARRDPTVARRLRQAGVIPKSVAFRPLRAFSTQRALVLTATTQVAAGVQLADALAFAAADGMAEVTAIIKIAPGAAPARRDRKAGLVQVDRYTVPDGAAALVLVAQLAGLGPDAGPWPPTLPGGPALPEMPYDLLVVDGVGVGDLDRLALLSSEVWTAITWVLDDPMAQWVVLPQALLAAAGRLMPAQVMGATTDAPPFQATRLVVEGSPPDQRTLSPDTLARWCRAVTRRRVGVALGGGGALGYVHVPFLQELLSHNVPIDIVTGSSFGAVVGAWWAAGAQRQDPGGNVQRLLEPLHWFAPQLTAAIAPVTTYGFQLWADLALGDLHLQALHLPYYPVVTDAYDGRAAVVRSGSIGLGVRASGSFPPYQPTVRGQHRWLDGGITANVPVVLAELAGADMVIASNPVGSPKTVQAPRPLPIPFLGDLIASERIVGRLKDLVLANLILLRGANSAQALSADVGYAAAVNVAAPWAFYKASHIASDAQHEVAMHIAVADAMLAYLGMLDHSLPGIPLDGERVVMPAPHFTVLPTAVGTRVLLGAASQHLLSLLADRLLGAELTGRGLQVDVTAQQDLVGVAVTEAVRGVFACRGVDASRFRSTVNLGEWSVAFSLFTVEGARGPRA